MAPQRRTAGRADRYTYVGTIDRSWLLYDHRDDPYELRNLMQDLSEARGRAGGRDVITRNSDSRRSPREVQGIVEKPYDCLG